MRRDLGIAALVAIAACSSASGSEPASGSERAGVVAAGSKVGPRPGIESNIVRHDYVGPRVCGDCHTDEYKRWSQSLHRVMNAKVGDDAPASTGSPSEPAVIGNFDDAIVHYAGGEAHFTHDRSGYTVAVRKRGVETRYRVTRTIGRRGLQEYVGIEEGHTDEVRLPFGWWPRRGGWYPQPYFDPWLGDEANFDAYAPVRDAWAKRCPWCHSTYPFEQRIERAAGPRKLGHGLEQLFQATPGPKWKGADSLGALGPKWKGADSLGALGSEQLAIDEQITTGISCESCHLGGRGHVAGGPIHFVPQGATAQANADVPTEKFADERRDANVVNAVCAQCHSGPSPRLADHTALRNSSEALDLEASPCIGIKCTDCHDPHRADARARDAETRSVAACTHCHTALADGAAAIAHAGTGHATTNCLDCHMPRVVMGIDRYVRTHRISSPTDRSILADAGPNACNLCHLDRSIMWTAVQLGHDWDVKLSPQGWATSYRDLDAPVGEVWLASTQPAFRLMAAHAYARSPFANHQLPHLLDGLGDSLAYVRSWTVFAIEDAIGRTLATAEFDPLADAPMRTRQLAALRTKLAH